ncbi:matrix protein [Wufeng Myotis altarium vesiculovirus 1]|uniref:matrix protein n=1 Tax=Wufeng Myotis altarium vesiculovirus 1 TaxID=2929011 RepID=UPI002482041F|nr:matrix protein [Wufeng Myotis altarium vesiculovirus 1]UOX72932.1 matrix protein [Wufeng Myotis altarium vesiculovirus 1]
MLSLRKNKRRRESKGEDFLSAGDPNPFWQASVPNTPEVSTSGKMLSVRFSARLRITSNTPFKSLEEVCVIGRLWEKDYAGYIGKRPFYRALFLILIRRLRPLTPAVGYGGPSEYVCDISGCGNFFHEIWDLPVLSSGEEIFHRSWDCNGRVGSVSYRPKIEVLDPDPDLPDILNPTGYSSLAEFEAAAKYVGVNYQVSDGHYVIKKSK